MSLRSRRVAKIKDNKPVLSEREFQAQVIELARLHKWRVAHFRPGKTQRGRWITPVQADGAGFPDLVMVRGNRLVFAELKSARGKQSQEQLEWYVDLCVCAVQCTEEAVAAYLWRPSDWPEIERILT